MSQVTLTVTVDPPIAKRICDLVDEDRFTIADYRYTIPGPPDTPPETVEKTETPPETVEKTETPPAAVSVAEAKQALSDYMTKTSVEDAKAKLAALSIPGENGAPVPATKVSQLSKAQRVELVASLAS